MSELPRGTVTFAFTDIEGSTALLKRLGEGYGEVLSAHRRLVRETFAAFDGVEIDTQGDAFFFVFIRARDAVEAAAEVQRAHSAYDWPAGAAVRMRIGLHTGEPSVGEEGYLGIDVVRAARLCGSCKGGQVLLSETARALLGSRLPAGVGVFPLGERHLKDIDEPERVYELEIEGLPKPPTAFEDVEPEGAGASQAGEDSAEAEDSWEDQLEKRLQSLTRRAITGVMDKLEEGLGGPRADRGTPPDDDSDGLGEMADHADDLAETIKQAISRALRPDD